MHVCEYEYLSVRMCVREREHVCRERLLCVFSLAAGLMTTMSCPVLSHMVCSTSLWVLPGLLQVGVLKLGCCWTFAPGLSPTSSSIVYILMEKIWDPRGAEPTFGWFLVPFFQPL